MILFSALCFTAECERQLKYYKGQEGIDIRAAQEKLSSLGYKVKNFNATLDGDMLYWVRMFCERNGLDHSDDGITDETWRFLMEGDAQIPYEDVENPVIYYGEDSERVAQLARRLKELGYYVDEQMSLSRYDDAMYNALDRFVHTNGISEALDKEKGISKILQDFILDNTAKGYQPPKVPSVVERARTYLMDENIIPMNDKLVSIPNYIWIAAVYVLCHVLTILLVYGVTREKNSARPLSNQVSTVPDSIRQHDYVDFSIFYRQKATEKRCEIRNGFSIGRSRCSLNLNDADKSVSKEHCTLRFSDDVLYLKDDSKYGTYVNSRLIHKDEVGLKSGDKLQIGEHMLIVRY